MICIEINIDDITKYFFVIIDIRDAISYKRKHLPKAINIPLTKLLAEPNKYLSNKDNYLLVCEYGIRSKKVSIILNNMGYHTFSLLHGMKEN